MANQNRYTDCVPPQKLFAQRTTFRPAPQLVISLRQSPIASEYGSGSDLLGNNDRQST